MDFTFISSPMSSSFENVSVIKRANVYFDGGVISRTIIFADGSEKTLGFMQAGVYEFGTEEAERMEVLGGEAEVKTAEIDGWKNFTAGESFSVPGKSSFAIRVKPGGLDYCCAYLT